MDERKVINEIIDRGIVAVVRASSHEKAESIIDACIKGGISVIEITFTVPNVESLIEKIVKKYRENDILIGAGTVTDFTQCKNAFLSGAEFIVGPGFDQDVLDCCTNNNVVYIPGCMTITEIMSATKKGCELIKLFPGSLFGPEFIKAVKGPLPDIKIMPTGGVDLENIEEWINSGAVALGIGSQLTYPSKSNDYDKIESIAKEFIEKFKKFRK